MISIPEIIKEIKSANFVFICGNGGSASTANHFANDLVKMCGIKAISLCANVAVLSAYANDHGYDFVFADQLNVLATRNDLLITMSGSGTSANIVLAQDTARELKIPYTHFPTMKDLECDMQRTEDEHLKWVHEITDKLSK